MDWVNQNSDVIFLIAAVVVVLLRSLRRRKGPAADEDPEQAERTRRIQEEIRRRILERRGVAPPSAPRDEDPMVEEPPPLIAELRPQYSPPPSAEPEADATPGTDDDRELARQQRMLREWQDLAAAATEKPAAAVPISELISGKSKTPPTGLLTDLRSRAGLRKAIVLREVLGPPVSMR